MSAEGSDQRFAGPLSGTSELRTIVFLSPSGQLGGAERVLIDVLSGLRLNHPDVRLLVVASATGPLRDAVVACGAQWRLLPFPPAVSRLGDAGISSVVDIAATVLRGLTTLPSVARYVAALRRILSSERVSLVHSNGAKMHIIASVAARAVAPVVWHLHDYAGGRRLMRFALRARAHAAIAAIAISDSVATDARASLGARVPVYTVMNGVDLEHFQPAGRAIELDADGSGSSLSPHHVRIGLVATYATWKGHSLFFAALAAVPAEIPWHAYVIGGPVYETTGSQYSMDDLIRMATAHGVAHRVTFTGQVSDVPSAYRALDIVVHASTSPEPFGLTIVEAMACGRAVVTSGTGGALDIARTGPGVRVVQSGDSAALANVLTELAQSREARLRLGREARSTAERAFSRERMAEEVWSVYSAATQAIGK